MASKKISNKRKIYLVLSVVFIAALLVCGIIFYSVKSHKTVQLTYVPDQSARDVTGNYGSEFSRIDSQITFKIPEGKADEVYQYLRDTYSKSDTFLKTTFPQYNLKGQPQEDVSIFVDDYFDTAYLDLYNSKNTIRFRHRENTLNRADPKSGRELVQIKITPEGRFDLRNELKFETKKNADNNLLKTQKLNLIEVVDQPLMEDFKKAIVPIKPSELSYILTNTQTRSRVYLNWDGENFLSFSVDVGQAKVLWADAKISSVDIGLVETAYTEGDEKKREEMRKINNMMIEDLQKRFPDLTKNSEDKYELLLGQIIEQIPFFEYLRFMQVV